MHHNSPFKIISLENLFLSFREFRRGKRKRLDVQFFERNLEDNLFELHSELKNKTYRHSDYTSFYITDPKLRHIHKACVRDRAVHHAVYRILYPIFDKTFIFDSYSCRIGKGTHKAINRLEKFTWKVSRNYTNPCWALKCDVKKFFNSVDHQILFSLIKEKIRDEDTLWLIGKIISSFNSKFQSFDKLRIKRERVTCLPKLRERRRKRGIPIGNLTSQLFANIYLDELDKFVKHNLKIQYYLRYCDDFVILETNRDNLIKLLKPIENFLDKKLGLSLHSDKVIIRKLKQGIDFCGYLILPHYRFLRTRTKKRILKRINRDNLTSYLGLLKHCNSYQLRQKIKKMV